jgi:catechol 2,3-dioxygenase-like lactoylglutathione lyase family enzyme
VLSVILSCDDLYAAADFFTDRLGWRLVFSTPPEDDSAPGPSACAAAPTPPSAPPGTVPQRAPARRRR